MKQFCSHFIFLFLLFGSFTVFNAQPSEEYELVSIEFEGNSAIADSRLMSVISSKESPSWISKILDSFTPFGSSASYFDSTAVAVDIISLKSFYARNGFFKAEISYKYQLDTLSKNASLTYIIRENEPFTYGSIKTHGLEELEEGLFNQIKPLVALSPEERYNEGKLTSQLEKAVTILRDNGYMLATFDSTIIQIDTVELKTNLDIYFTAGNKYYFNKIVVQKNGVSKDLVSDELIKYVTNINEGEIYNQDKLALSRVRLARTGLFETVNLTGAVDDTVGNKVPLLIYGEIGPLNEFAPEVFIDNEFNTSNLGIGISYVRKNFLGDARKLTIGLRFKLNDITQFRFSSQSAKDSTFQTQLDASMQLEQPFLFSRNISGSMEAFVKNYNISTTHFDNYGGKILIGVDMPSYTFINLLNPYYKLDVLRYDVDFNSVNIPLNLEQSTLTSILGTELGSSRTNDIFFPNEGYNLTFILELAASNNVFTGSGKVIEDSLGVKESVEERLGLYYKIDATIAKYFSISNDKMTVLGIKLRTGYIQNYKGGPELIPPNQTFFVGGANSVRGWRARELVPTSDISFIGLTKPVENNIRGGTFVMEGSIENRRKFSKDFGYAIFFDYGNTWNDYRKIRFKDVAVAWGFGIRYFSPFAPFRIDIGWKLWDPNEEISLFQRPFLKSFEVHFGIGEAF